MKLMLDTNICIYIIKRKPEEVIKRLQEHDPSDLCISSITYAELMHGVMKSKAVMRNRVALTILLKNIAILNFDANAAEHYGAIRADLEQKGTPIGTLDMMIAAHARSLGCILITNNTREFERVENLIIDNCLVEGERTDGDKIKSEHL